MTPNNGVSSSEMNLGGETDAARKKAVGGKGRLKGKRRCFVSELSHQGDFIQFDLVDKVIGTFVYLVIFCTC